MTKSLTIILSLCLVGATVGGCASVGKGKGKGKAPVMTSAPIVTKG